MKTDECYFDALKSPGFGVWRDWRNDQFKLATRLSRALNLPGEVAFRPDFAEITLND